MRTLFLHAWRWFVGAVLSWPALVFAQTSVGAGNGANTVDFAAQASRPIDSYAVSKGDAALDMLASIFGSANGIFGGSNDRIDNMFLAFNIAVSAVAAAYFSYNIITATVQGSFDGEVLGKRYHSMWFPIRHVTGATFLVPVWKGWSLAQLLMAFSASVGIGIGNTVHSGLNGAEIQTLPAPVPLVNVQELASEIVRGQSCLNDARLERTRAMKTSFYRDYPDNEYFRIPFGSKFAVVKETDDEDKIHEYATVSYGSQPAFFGHVEDECGTARVELPKPRDKADTATIAIVTKAQEVARQVTEGFNVDLERVYLAAYGSVDPDDPDQMQAAREKLRTDGKAVLKKWSEWQTKQATAQANTISSIATAQMKELSEKYGWLSAGLAPALQAIQTWDAAQAAPRAGAGKAPDKSPAAEPTQTSTCDSFSNAIRGGHIIDNCIEKPLIRKVKAEGLASLFGQVSNDPLQLGPTVGIKMVRLAFVLIAVILGLMGLITTAAAWWGITTVGIGAVALGPAASILGSVLQFFGLILTLFCVPLLIFGAQLTVLLPLAIPIAWIMAVGGWLLIVAESLIAAPLWAMVHFEPDGEGMGQKTAHGYLFLLNLLFRPAILVFAAWFAFRFCAVLGEFANTVMSPIIARLMEVNEDSLFMLLFMMICGAWALLMLNTRIVSVAASLLYLIPNQIFTWLGAHFGSDVGRGVEAQIDGDVQGSMQTAGRAAGGIGDAVNTTENRGDRLGKALDRMKEVSARQRGKGGITGGGGKHDNGNV